MLDYIDAKLSPDSKTPGAWFRDSPNEEKLGYSFLGDDAGLREFRPILLDYLSQEGQLFDVVRGKLHAKETKIWDWFRDLGQVVDYLFYLLYVTCPGAGRGTEWEKLYWANHQNHSKNFHCLNGIPSLNFIYDKMMAARGYAKSLIRTPAFQVSRILILVLNTAYYAAEHLGACINWTADQCKNYSYRMFVSYGEQMSSVQFSTALANISESTLGLRIGIRDYRQLDKVLMSTKCELSFEDPDEEEEEAVAKHGMHGHSAKMGRQHYGLTSTNSTEKLAPDQVEWFQRIGIAWHWTIGFIHPHHRREVYQSRVSDLDLCLDSGRLT